MAGAYLDHALLRQADHRFADGRAAHAQAGGGFLLQQLRAGRQGGVQHQALQLAVGAVRLVFPVVLWDAGVRR